jgi:hypothetical protein
MMSNEDEHYIEVVVLNKIYNLVVQTFFIWDILYVQIYTTRFCIVNTKGVQMLHSNNWVWSGS